MPKVESPSFYQLVYCCSKGRKVIVDNSHDNVVSVGIRYQSTWMSIFITFTLLPIAWIWDRLWNSGILLRIITLVGAVVAVLLQVFGRDPLVQHLKNLF